MPARTRTKGSSSEAATLSGAQRRKLIREARQSTTEDGARGGGRAHDPAADKRDGEVPSIFVCYSREDLAVVEPFIERLREGGAKVTWDQDFPAGADIDQIIRDAIRTVQAVVVVWSASSAQSHFVRDEARRAFKAAKLITIHVAGFDPDEEVPVGFGQLNTVPLDDVAMVRKSLASYGIELTSSF